MSHPAARRGLRCLVPLLAAACTLVGPAAAPAAEVRLSCLTDRAPACGQARLGILRLLSELRRRTSVDVAALPDAFDPRRDAAPAQPMLLWAPDDHEARSHAQDGGPTQTKLSAFLAAGGSLLVDVGPGEGGERRDGWVRPLLERAAGGRPFAPVPPTHVLSKTFYLAQPPRGRLAAPQSPEGLTVQGRLAVVLLHHGLFEGLATGEAAAGGQDEMDLRWAINWMLLGLCGDYKDDHVHLPYILKRRTP